MIAGTRLNKHWIGMGCLALSVFAQVAPASAATSWEITESVAALTQTRDISAVLPSEQPLINMIGQPQHAALVLRCKDRVVATYISWPEVVPQSVTTFGGRSQAMILWRLDDRPIDASFWLRVTSGTAVGSFETKPAVKLIGRFVGAKRLAVRLTGQTTQDAAFDLGDIASVAARIVVAHILAPPCTRNAFSLCS